MSDFVDEFELDTLEDKLAEATRVIERRFRSRTQWITDAMTISSPSSCK